MHNTGPKGVLCVCCEMLLDIRGCGDQVRLWAEAIVEAIALINVQLTPIDYTPPKEGELNSHGIGGPDIPSLVLFLTCTNE